MHIFSPRRWNLLSLAKATLFILLVLTVLLEEEVDAKTGKRERKRGRGKKKRDRSGPGRSDLTRALKKNEKQRDFPLKSSGLGELGLSALKAAFPERSDDNTSIDEGPRPWKINQDICPPVLCGETPEVAAPLTSAEVHDGVHGSAQQEPVRTQGDKKRKFAFFEGDIVLDEEMQARLETPRERKPRSIVRPISRLWKYGIVPFVIDQSLGENTRNLVEAAFAEIEKKTCITFRQRTSSDKDFLHYVNSPGCWSLVGKKGDGAQYVSLGDGCDHLGTILHETAHALGFWHEQSRPDRDKYVKVMEENIPKMYQNQFGKRTSSQSTSRGYAYDYESIMHYGHKYFTGNGKPTLEVIGIGMKKHLKIGQRKALSNIDVAQLRAMYYCDTKQANAEACKKGWFKDQRMCYKFVSDDKKHFSGAERQCQKLKGRLVNIKNKNEDDFLKKYLIHHHPNITKWRTGGKLRKKKYVWVGKKGKRPVPMNFTAWAPGQPGRHTSLILSKFNGTPPRFVWKAEWTGSSNSIKKYGFNYICESNLNVDCIHSKYKDARDYRGFKSYTTGGVTCQKWSSQYPHSHKYMTGDSGKDALNGLGDHNFCRNPRGKRERPWCFVPLRDVQWQYCDIEVCEEE